MSDLATWIDAHVPTFLATLGPAGMAWWKWLATVVVVVLAWILGALAGALSRRIGHRIIYRGKSAATTAERLPRLGPPLTLAWTVFVARLLYEGIAPTPSVAAVVSSLIHGLLLFAFFWGLFRLIDTLRDGLGRTAWALSRPGSRALLPLGAQVTKVLVAAMAIVALLSELGFPVASLIAGLGIGGLAIALAAQKTVENLFGAFAMGVDQPFRPGDFIKIGDLSGNVEHMGLRSTRIRTLDRTVVTVPNAKLSDGQIESFAERDRIRLAMTVGLVYDTTPAQMRAILAGIDARLRAMPKVNVADVRVRFIAMAASSLDVEILASFATADFGEFTGIRQDALLTVMDAVVEGGSSFAFPTRTIYNATLSATPAALPSATRAVDDRA